MEAQGHETLRGQVAAQRGQRTTSERTLTHHVGSPGATSPGTSTLGGLLAVGPAEEGVQQLPIFGRPWMPG